MIYKHASPLKGRLNAVCSTRVHLTEQSALTRSIT